MLTEPVHYGKPGLQDHIDCLAGMTRRIDQKIGRDAIDRYAVLHRELDEMHAEVERVLSPRPRQTRAVHTTEMTFPFCNDGLRTGGTDAHAHHPSPQWTAETEHDGRRLVLTTLFSITAALMLHHEIEAQEPSHLCDELALVATSACAAAAA